MWVHIFINREAGEIMHLLASVCLSVCLFVCLFVCLSNRVRNIFRFTDCKVIKQGTSKIVQQFKHESIQTLIMKTHDPPNPF